MGDTVAESIEDMMSSEDGEEAMIEFTAVDSDEEYEEALANNGYYGYFVIPADFCETMIASQTVGQDSSAQTADTDAAAGLDISTIMSAARGAGHRPDNCR